MSRQPYVFQGGVNHCYPSAVATLVNYGSPVSPRNKDTLEIGPVIFSLERMNEFFVTSVGKLINIPFALAECIWILSGQNKVDVLEFYNSNISQFADDGEIWGAYGKRLASHGQLDAVVAKLRRDPDSRQAVITYWDSHLDNVKGKRDYPCNVLSHLMIRDNKLEWTQFIRSNDALWGTPYNFIQFSVLMNYVANILGVETGNMTVISDSFHVYKDLHKLNNLKEAKKIRHFNLYKFFDQTYTPIDFRADPFQLSMAEKLIRIGKDIPPFEFGRFWEDVFWVLKAYCLFKSKATHESVEDVINQIYHPIMKLLVLKDFYQWRWRLEYSATALIDVFDGELLNFPHLVRWLDDVE